MTAREWLLSDTPQSRSQARMGRLYGGWLAFIRNRLAMVGLGIVVALMLMALLAPLIATHHPFAQDLANRLQPPSAARWASISWRMPAPARSSSASSSSRRNAWPSAVPCTSTNWPASFITTFMSHSQPESSG